jgi:uncharacterized protein
MSGPLRLAALLAFLCLTPCTRGQTVPTLPMPAHYVEDRAGVIDPGREQTLNEILHELEQKTTIQYIILTVPTLGGVTIEQFAMDLADRQWKLGQAGKDNGFLFVLASRDRKYRFEVGRGLESILPNSLCDNIGRQTLVPLLQQGRMSDGIYQANLAVIRTIARSSGVTLSGLPMPERAPAPMPNQSPASGPLSIPRSMPMPIRTYPPPPLSRVHPGQSLLWLPCVAVLLLLLAPVLVLASFVSRTGRGPGMRSRHSSRFGPSAYDDGTFYPYHHHGGFFGGPFGGFGGSMGGGAGGFGGFSGGGSSSFGGGGGGSFGGGGASGSW